MSIRQLLIISISILSLFVAGLAGTGFYKTWHSKETLHFAQGSNNALSALLGAAGNWAVERGVTNSGLQSVTSANPAVLETIKARREQGDEAYASALKYMQSLEFYHKEEMLHEVSEAFEKVKAYRKRADRQLSLPKHRRDPGLLTQWVPTMSALVMKSQHVRFVITQHLAEADPELGRQGYLKHFSWMMSEYAGRERAVIGGILSAQSPISIGKLKTLGIFRGKLEAGWEVVQEFGALSNAQVQATLAETEETVFGPFQKTREAIYSAGIHGQAYPLGVQEWIKQSTAAINTMLATQTAASQESKAHVKYLIAKEDKDLLISGVILLISLAVALYSFYLVVFRVVRPIEEMTDAMQSLAEGDTSVDVPATERSDEIGLMAASVQVFKENAIESDRLRSEQAAVEARAEEEKKKTMNALADSFEGTVQAIIQTVASASTQLAQTAELMTNVVSRSGDMATSATQDAQAASQNVDSVAAAAEEMSSTVQEIANQVQKSNEMVRSSVITVEEADGHAKALVESSHQIQEVTKLISSIAGNINLLALNATIESARAGEAGKGFAVVAGEVKNLASQTDKSIQEIGRVISDMDSVSGDIVASLTAIKDAFGGIEQSSGSVATAVEEQSAATDEIARNMQTAAAGTQNISRSLVAVNEGSVEARTSSEQVLEAARELSVQSVKLQDEVTKFLNEVREA